MSRTLRVAQCRALAAACTLEPVVVVEHTNPRCRAPLEPCRCAHVHSREVLDIDGELTAHAGRRITRLQGGLS